MTEATQATLTKAQVLSTIEGDTHVLWTLEFLDVANAAFGTTIEPRDYAADPTDPKGLTLNNGGAVARGISSYDLATSLCRAFNLPIPGMIGRGFMVRACVSLLREAGHC